MRDGDVWRPYDADPLFTGDLVRGWDFLNSTSRAQLVEYLGVLLRVRKAPVSVAVAWNAVYFGFDVRDGGSYVGGPLELDAFPQVSMGESLSALPVGAMVQVKTGRGPVYAEVIYKEGAYPEVADDGCVPPWLSGAPATAQDERGGDTVLTERLVCDFGAFGPDFSASRASFAKLRSQGRWVDEYGHLVVRSRYTAADAELDDVDFYAQYLVNTAETLLRSPTAPQPLLFLLDDAVTREDILAAVLSSLGTIRDALRHVPGARMWGTYTFRTSDLQARLDRDGPLGGADLDAVASGISRPSRERSGTRFAAPSARVDYIAIGARLRQLTDARHECSEVRYAAAVVHANIVLADRIDREASAGILPTGAHVRLDDRWQSGGVWRIETPAGHHTGTDIRVPLGLGWWDSRGDVAGEAAEENTADGDWARAGYATDLDTGADYTVTWTVTLRREHLVRHTCPLPEQIATALTTATATATLHVVHPQRHVDDLVTDYLCTGVDLRDGHGLLTGIEWPASLLPATILTLTWNRSTALLTAQSTLLETAVLVDGIHYDHLYDVRVVIRDFEPGHAHSGVVLSLQGRVLRAVRHLGYLCSDGSVVFDHSKLPVAVYGTPVPHGAAERLAPTVDGLLTMRILRRGIAARVGGWLRYPRRGRVGAPVAVLMWRPAIEPVSTGEPSEPTGIARVVAPARVAPHLRRIAGVPSDSARSAYRALVAHYGLAGDPELPLGYTLVREHRRGMASQRRYRAEGELYR